MEMEIILMQDVNGLGAQGDIMKVSHGYARNFLFPQKLAAPATPAHVKMLEMEKKRKEAEARRAMVELRKEAGKLSAASCTIPARAGEDGKLFGSVTAQDIADQLVKAGFAIDKKQIVLPEPLKELGVFTVEVKFHQDITAPLKVWVVESKGSSKE
ncbi:MAG: 50S ribosomal protein L9 [Candidatus Aureabacteria bacterium]|nr:50S ribosomal protein L9 [Candidatus Auribacterota bacterium]